MTGAAARCAALDGGHDDPTLDELAARVGNDLVAHLPAPGERCGNPDLDVARHWPAVPPDLDQRAG